MICFRCILIRK